MFVTTQLNQLMQILVDDQCSESVIEHLEQRFVNLEATLLRAKVLREFSKQKNIAIIQSAIELNHASLAYLFSPFILANLNQTVIYSTPLTEQVLQILKPYYQIEKTLNFKKLDENVLDSLNLFLDFQDSSEPSQDFLYIQFINALTQADVSTIFLITTEHLNQDCLFEIEKFFNVRIFQIQPERPSKIIDQALNMQKLLFKRKDDFHVDLCRQFSELNAQILYLSGLYDVDRAKNLVEDMFYSEHIYEKLSVYAEYMQTQIQNKVFSTQSKLTVNS